MCGIYGMAVRTGAAIDRDLLRRMGDALGHRGPDDRGVHVAGPVALGATRLAIIDLETGQQPVTNEDGSVVAVQNGEIYNYRALREELADGGHRFRAAGDTEVLPHLYEDAGLEFPERLRGMFAVAVWDAVRGRLVLARDRMGIKPLFWAETPDGLLFASELGAILATGFPKHLDRQALHDYLSLDYVPGPRSMFDGIRKLPPGHVLQWDARQVKAHAIAQRRYWHIPPTDGTDGNLPRDPAELVRFTREALSDAVTASMVSDVPVGAFLSGGLDSSVVVALMQRATDHPVRTFSIGFDDPSYDERSWARRVAEHVGTDHHERVVRPDPHAMLERMVDVFDEPFADSSAIAAWAVSEEAARHVKVVMSGDGGDEVFGGYVFYRADRLAHRFPASLGRMAGATLRGMSSLLPASDGKMSWDLKLERFAKGVGSDPVAAHHAWREILDEDAKRSLYTDRGAEAVRALRPTGALLREAFDANPGDDLLNRFMAVDMSVSLVDDMLTKVDRTSMAHSLEVRVPLLDPVLVDFVARVPSRFKVTPIHRGLQLKWLLKEVARDLLPAEIVDRPKAGFHVPVPRWLKDELRPVVHDRLGATAIRDQGLFDPAAVDALVQSHLSGRANRSRALWGLLVFSTWWERHFG